MKKSIIATITAATLGLSFSVMAAQDTDGSYANACDMLVTDSANMELRTSTNLRNVSWMEVILWCGEGENAKGGVTFNTKGLNDPKDSAPEALQKTMNKEEFKARYNAGAVSFNPDQGRRYWTVDTFEMTASDTVRNFNGMDTRYVGTVTPMADGSPVNLSAESLASWRYTEMEFDRISTITYDAGKPVFVITDGEGKKWVNKTFQTGINPNLSMKEMHNLEAHYKHFPEGWTYEVVILEKDLVLIADGDYPIMWDEFGGSFDIIFPEVLEHHPDLK